MMTRSEQGHILIVDDNEMNREVLSRRLERQGYSYALAEDGARALELLREQEFDLVLLDIMMPKMNGYQVLEALKADRTRRLGGASRDLPVIVVSAVDELDSIVKCVELGAEDYLFKPFNPVLLRARIGACLEKKRMHDQAQAVSQAVQQLRGPLTEVKESIEKLMSGGAGLVSTDQAKLLAVIEAGVAQAFKVFGWA